MTRSFWKIPRAAWLTTDEEGTIVNAFENVVVYHETPQFLHVIAAEADRPDIAAIGTRLGQTVRELNPSERANFLRVEVERDSPDGKIRAQVKVADKRPTDVEKAVDIPAVIWFGDDPADYAP